MEFKTENGVYCSESCRKLGELAKHLQKAKAELYSVEQAIQLANPNPILPDPNKKEKSKQPTSKRRIRRRLRELDI